MNTTVAALFICSIVTVKAQSTNSIRLWPEDAPGALGSNPKDIPTLTPFFPDPTNATGAAMVICPGGGYQRLAPHEGETYARWLADNGVAGFVLKYRLGGDGYRHPVPLLDAARAVRTVRSRAREWNIDPHRIGIMGSSAGGHVASTLLTHFDSGRPDAEDPVDRISSRPDLGILCYAVITMGPFTHEGSKTNLLGRKPPKKLIRELSNELQVTKETPPCFIWHTDQDRVVPVENSLQFAEALRHAGVPFDLHIYQKGGHGQGLGTRVYPAAKGTSLLPWATECIGWLRVQGFVGKAEG